MDVRRPAAKSTNSAELHYEVERFLFREARLLDERRLKEWLELFTEDVRYWMPVRINRLCSGNSETWEVEKEVTGDHQLAFFDDDINMLRRRVARFDSGTAWSENPPSRTRHLTSNVEVEDLGGDEYSVRSYFMIYQSRLESNVSIYAGERIDLLRRVDGSLKVSHRKIILDSATLATGNMSILF